MDTFWMEHTPLKDIPSEKRGNYMLRKIAPGVPQLIANIHNLDAELKANHATNTAP
jgi:hypothetical protein